jgi:FkbM family methyltransferase
MSLPPWIAIVEEEGPDRRWGVQVRDILSGNDGDVCNSVLTSKLLRPGNSQYVLDIGVDKGWWSFFVAEQNPAVEIDAFEPNPISFRSLVPKLDSIPQMRLHNIAVSDHSGFLPFTLAAGDSHSREKDSAVSLPCTTVDRYIRNRHVDLVKIDTEGHDLHVLRSLFPFLERIDAILFECTPYWYGETQEECVKNTCEALNHLHAVYGHMYTLSRRGPPTLYEISREGIDAFVRDSYEQNKQTDIFVCKRKYEDL